MNDEHTADSSPRSKGDGADSDEESPLAKALAGLELRSIGPAFMGGRIASIAIHPRRPSTWYVAAGSGGVWKTTNAGTTWTPIFDDQRSYSIGCVSVDPSQPDVIWVGTGEAVSGRHVGWGSGVYRSRDGGRSWEHLGLADSEHIAVVDVDPRDSNSILVAAEGPLWRSGGDRGVYRSSDGGVTWAATLTIDDDTGVTSLVRAPDNPDVVYAAAYQRRRHVATFVGGGPGSGIHKSTDGGVTWRRITEGLPEGDMGKIGLAVTPADPDLVYATIEAEKKERGFHRSTDRGERWERRNEYISGGTGPHYYQEIIASPVDAHRVYQVDVFLRVTRDGGKTFDVLETAADKHADNHAVWIDPDRPDHLLVGTDGGLYETFDEGATFRHFPNLPIAQFYRVAVDNGEPFASVLAGAQDLGTLLGPLRTTNVDGVRNRDWTVPLGADGYQVAFDPVDPDICYMEWQVGNVVRFNRRTGERTDIQPQPSSGEPPERWNWDSPILISPHNPERIMVASQRVWRSENRGDSWQPISPDLTTDRDRYRMESFGAVPSIDALYDHGAMSLYSTITALSESPIVPGVLYAGTDDGRIQISEDDGGTWRQTGPVPDLPDEAFINHLEACRHNINAVFLAADDHKHGDFSPYLYRSSDRGHTWESIRGDLPDGTIVWAIKQDHLDPDLLFLAAEFGIHVSLNGGRNWHALSGGVPTIAFRSLAVQRRDDDLVGASFGRGIYVLDDFSPLRSLHAADLTAEATLFPVRDAWWYMPEVTAQAEGQPELGTTAFRAPNPPFGAVITYHLAEDLHGPRAARRAREKQARADGNIIEVPDFDLLWEEEIAGDPVLAVVIRDDSGRVVRRLPAEAKAGIHRAAWDLRSAPPAPVSLEEPGFRAPWDRDLPGPLVAPGRYRAELALWTADGTRMLGRPEEFTVQAIPAVADQLEDADHRFREDTAQLLRDTLGATSSVERQRDRLKHLRATATQTATDDLSLVARVEDAHRRLEELARELSGDPVRQRLAEADEPSIAGAARRVAEFHWHTTGRPTSTQIESVERSRARMDDWQVAFGEAIEEIDSITHDLDQAGGTWTRR